MDEIDRRIIGLLAEDARRALAEIGAAVGLSASAVNDRIRRLQAQGAIRRFTVDTDPAALGLPVLAFVWVALRDGADEPAFRAYAAAHPAVTECHHVTGPWSYLLRLRLPDLAAVETVLAQFKAQGSLGRSETVLALSSPAPGAHVPGGRP